MAKLGSRLNAVGFGSAPVTMSASNEAMQSQIRTGTRTAWPTACSIEVHNADLRAQTDMTKCRRNESRELSLGEPSRCCGHQIYDADPRDVVLAAPVCTSNGCIFVPFRICR
jgi:hypothetical protein